MEWNVFLKNDENTFPMQDKVIMTNGKWVEVGEFMQSKVDGIYQPFFRNESGIVTNVTHWMSLPQPPTNKEKINE
jgi:hypothetical protein